MIPLIAVVGPTATGKTALALALAERLDTEIISADSMQVYRGMAIGTAAPTAAERARVPHHFVGTLDPGAPFSAGAFQRAAREVAGALRRRGRVPVAAGGSGLYVRALIDGLFEGPGGDAAVRKRLADEAERHGTAALYARLEEADPAYARAILPNDLRRIIRALEVYETTGTPLSALHVAQEAVPIPALQVAIDLPRAALYARIDRRVEHMVAEGFLDEVQALREGGHGPALAQLRSVGYREFLAHLEGRLSLAEATAAMQQATRRLARRQLSWFKKDPRIVWLPPAPPGLLAAHVLERLAVR